MDNVIEATSVFEILITVFHIKKSNYPVMCDLLFGYFFLSTSKGKHLLNLSNLTKEVLSD